MAATDVVAWWGAITGTVSAGVLIWRIKWDRGAESRETQKQIRTEIRASLEQLDQAFAQARTALRNGDAIGEPPTSLAGSAAAIYKHRDRITDPHPVLVYGLDLAASRVESRWGALHWAESDREWSLDDHGNRREGAVRSPRKVEAAAAELRSSLDKAERECKSFMAALNAIDKGEKKRPPASS